MTTYTVEYLDDESGQLREVGPFRLHRTAREVGLTILTTGEGHHPTVREHDNGRHVMSTVVS